MTKIETFENVTGSTEKVKVKLIQSADELTCVKVIHTCTSLFFITKNVPKMHIRVIKRKIDIFTVLSHTVRFH